MSINIIEIKDFDADELDVYARLSEGQLLNRAEPGKGIFIAESPKVIERALDAGYEPISCLIEKKHIDGEGKTYWKNAMKYMKTLWKINQMMKQICMDFRYIRRNLIF